MTRNREIDCEDLFGCDHSPETPITDDTGEVINWICRCGELVRPIDVTEPPKGVKEET